MKKLILILLPLLILFSGCSHNGPDKENEDPSQTNKTSNTKSSAKLSTQGQFYSVEGTTDGIKLKLKDGLNIRDNAGSTIRVFEASGKELPLYITIDSSERNSRKEYIYRFVEADKEYTIEWFFIFVDNKGKESMYWDKTKCTPKGGLKLSDYLNVSKVENAKMSLKYDNANSQFEMKLLTDAETLEDFVKVDSAFSKVSFTFRTLLGELNWTHTEYVADRWLVLKGQNLVSGIYSAKVNGFKVDRNVTDKEKQEYNNKYCGQLMKQFVYDEGAGSTYSKTIYENNYWTEQLKFN